MRVVFLGTPDFAVPSLNAIYDNGFEIVGVITQPDRAVGRKLKLTPCETKAHAVSLGLPVFTFESLKRDGVELLRSLAPDVMVTAAYGQILSQEILDIPRFGTLNVHASLLPKYRGAAPIQWAVINGESVTGVTIMRTELGLDSGDIVLQRATDIGENETAGELFDRLSLLGAELIVEALRLVSAGKAVYTPQEQSLATCFSMLKKTDGLIDFTQNCESIRNRIRGVTPWPSAYTYVDGKLLKIFSVSRVGDNSSGIACGTVVTDDVKSGLTVACADGIIRLCEIQLENCRRMTDSEFLLGRKIGVGTALCGVKR